MMISHTMASTSKSQQCQSLSQLLTSWGVGELSAAFEKAEIDLTSIKLLDETTARAILSPGAFLKFWHIYSARKEELVSKRLNVELHPPSPKRLRTDSNDSAVSEVSESELSQSDSDCEDDDKVFEELKALFESTFVGRLLLATNYDDRSDSDRNRIAEIIITEELRKSRPVGHISRGRFISLSKLVPKLFQGEDKFTFYVPYRKVNNQVFTAKGKLPNQYYFWRQKVQVTQDEASSLKWLNVNLGPENIVLEHWRKTYTSRMSLLDVQRDNKIDLAKYFSDFPVLRQPIAVKLFSQDYESLYSGTEGNLETNFPAFAQKLILKFEKLKNFDKSVLTYLQGLLDSNLAVTACHHFFVHLSNLFPPTVVVRGRKPNNWTANKAEMQRGFLLHVTSEHLLEEATQERVDHLKSFKKTLAFTPFPAIVGRDLKSVEKCLVVLQRNDRYIVASPQEAIDVTFKAIHALCLDYPPESKLF